MNNIVNLNQVIKPLTHLQAKYALINLSGEIRIVDLQQVADVLTGKQPEINYYKRSEGQILIQREMENLPYPCKPKEEFNHFLVNPNTHVYTAIAFSPLQTPATTLNYWVPAPISPKEGDWFLIQEFLQSVICDYDVALHDYLIRYLAHMLQHPEEKPGIIIVLLSGEGTGKGRFYQLLKRIWPRITLQVSDIDQVIGRFNAALERNFVIWMDEALFAGDKKSLDKLKSLITEPTCHIEQKYQPSRTIDSFHRFFATSNHYHFANVAKDDRRFLFIRVSSVHKQDDIYFDSVSDALDKDDVIAAMIYDLMELDLTGFNVRKRPITHEHTNQRLQSLNGFERFWFEVLQTGSFKSGFYSIPPWKQSVFISTDSIIQAYKEYDRNATKYQPLQSQQLAVTLKTLCPSAVNDRQTVLGRQERGYQLPNILIARTEFEKLMGTHIEWPEFDDENESAIGTR